MATMGLLLLACAGLDPIGSDNDYDDLGGEVAEARPSGSLEGLAGVRIWVQVRDPSTRASWCQAFEAQGMIVECEDSPDVDMYEVFLKCPTIPDGAGRQIARFVGQPGMDIWDWREDSSFGPGYCDSFDAISLELMR